MQRLRLTDVRNSRAGRSVGLCKGDINAIADIVNSAQRRLLYAKEAGDEGWFGTWAEVAFNVDQTKPYITLPREIARLEAVTICDRPVAVQNQWYEYLQFGNGRLPKRFQRCNRPLLQVLSRNNTPTFVDLTKPPQFIAVYPSDPADNDRRILIQGLDNNGNEVLTLDGPNQVHGVFLHLQMPFQTAPMQFNWLTGIQKDITVGPVQVFQVDPTTGMQVLLLTMEPNETTAWYRRYFLTPLPVNCCPATVPQGTAPTVQVTAMAKLDFIPVTGDTDYLMLQNQEALVHEIQSIRYSEMDSQAAINLSAIHHKEAIRLLNGELQHFFGNNHPAISFEPFGSAHLERQKIGTLI